MIMDYWTCLLLVCDGNTAGRFIYGVIEIVLVLVYQQSSVVGVTYHSHQFMVLCQPLHGISCLIVMARS